jgi:hypothetical protein
VVAAAVAAAAARGATETPFVSNAEVRVGPDPDF